MIKERIKGRRSKVTKTDCVSGTLKDLWEKRGFTNMIIADISMDDIGKLREELARCGIATKDLTVDAIACIKDLK